MRIGYARVSSADQNLARQIKSLKEAGCEKIFQEKISGKNMERPELREMLDYIRLNDVVVVSSLDRLGRNSDDIKDILGLIKRKEATVDILDLPSFSGVSDSNLRNLLTNLVIELMSYVAQNEREKIRERQKQGIAIAKQKGIYQGKSQEYSANAHDPQKRVIYQQIVNDLTADKSILSISNKYGVARNTIYRIKKEFSEK